MYFSETEEDILSFIEDNDVKFIRLTFCDTFGNMRNLAILPRELHHAVQYGIPFNATGLLESGHKNLLLKPDISTLSILPWRPQSGRVVRFFCTLYQMDGTPYHGDLRNNLAETVQSLESYGYSCEMGTRCEFYLFETDMNGNPTHIPCDHGGYLDVAPLDACENTRREICLSLDEMGINPTVSCHKSGPGQNEIDFADADPLSAADNMIHYKNVVKTIAAQNGQYASFMPKPIPNHSGSALKITISVLQNGKSIFGDSRDDMTDDGRAFIAGILNRAEDFTVFSNPTINSYDRLGIHTAPSNINWSDDNRVPLIQICYAPGRPTSLEFRAADAFCNPYITFQLLLSAGFAGIRNHEILTDVMDAASDTAVFSTLPDSLQEAIDFAKKSNFVQSVIPETTLRDFIHDREKEVAECLATGNAQEFCFKHYF